MSTWNYRIMAVPHPQKGWEEVYLTVNDVNYYSDGKPKSYGELNAPPFFRRGSTPGGDDMGEVTKTLSMMLLATTKPILCSGDRWPQEYKP